MSGPAPAVRIVVADDHQIVRTGFAELLATQPDFEVVATAGDGGEAVRACRELSPDVVHTGALGVIMGLTCGFIPKRRRFRRLGPWLARGFPACLRWSEP
ncbi:hypothetical protein HNP84_006638 [Thermocatellispora tengchongensis]|uniref:Response regulatory domain-containing protein n=1 Tax=Thermocatellispora tengchongensis TaxID=1073253 RepID=A0A840PDS8_9ACTN|nr:response regulator transcription factor [Thermocatellispora tengchongensis]MBB5136886.1 hypothetical protein [Thermocatellispora tengchongensis]